MSRRRVAGMTLFVAGGLMFSFAGGKYALGAAAQDDARRHWDEAEARAAVNVARAKAIGDRSHTVLVEGEPVARLVIPKIGLDEIVLEGISDDALNGGPGHFPGSPLPGRPGNAIISAHRDRHFRKLDDLEVGDTLTTEAGSAMARWVIVSKRVVDKDAPALFPSKRQRLTLTTCWPIRYIGSAPDRLIVTAEPAIARKN
jgi:sortase A